MLVYAIGFSAMFLGNVLFLTQVWGYSILRAGLAISVGPLIVAVTAPLFGRLAGRIGQRALLVPGGLVWAVGGVYLLARATDDAGLPRRLPAGRVLTGLGVALCCRSCRRPRCRACPPDQFGSGSAVNQAIRNLGATFGVALVVAFTSDLDPATALDAFHRVWILLAASGVIVTMLSTRLRTNPNRSVGQVPNTHLVGEPVKSSSSSPITRAGIAR